MYRIMAFIALCVSAYITLTYLALMVRVFIGIFSEGSGVLASFVYTVTEPILIPIRQKLDKIEMLQDIPLDISVFVAAIILMVLGIFLPSVV